MSSAGNKFLFEYRQGSPLKRCFNVPLFIGVFTNTARRVRELNYDRYNIITELVSELVDDMMYGFSLLDDVDGWKKAYKELNKLEMKLPSCRNENDLVKIAKRVVWICKNVSLKRRDRGNNNG